MLGIKGAVFGNAACLLVGAFLCDFVVVMLSLANWAVHSAALVAVALTFAAVGWAITLVSLHEGLADLAGYDKVAFSLATIGGLAAGADYYVEST
jgi:hypothetical protein